MQLVTLKFRQIVHASLYHPFSQKRNRNWVQESETAIATGMKVDTCQSTQNGMNVWQAMQNIWIKFTQLLSGLAPSQFSLSSTFSFAFYSADAGKGDRVSQPEDPEDAAGIFDPYAMHISSKYSDI